MPNSLEKKKQDWLSKLSIITDERVRAKAFTHEIIEIFLKIEKAIDDIDSDEVEIVFNTEENDPSIHALIVINGSTDESPDAVDVKSQSSVYFIQCYPYLPSDFELRMRALKAFRMLEHKYEQRSIDSNRRLYSVIAEARKSENDFSSVNFVVLSTEPLSAKQQDILEAVVLEDGSKLYGDKFEHDRFSLNDLLGKDNDDSELKVRLNFRAKASEGATHIGVCSFDSVFQFMEGFRLNGGFKDITGLYEKNIRGFLSLRGSINKSISNTIHQEPENFVAFNNGITIIADEIQSPDQSSLVLKNPYIVNGCQTSNIIYKEMIDLRKKQKKNGSTETNANATVVVKVIKVDTKKKEITERIVKCSNSQNAVKEKDFVALNTEFKAIQQDIQQKFDVYFEIQRGAWESQTGLKPAKGSKQKMIRLSEALKVYGAAWLRKAGSAMSSSVLFAPKGKVFDLIMAQEPAISSDDMYAAYVLKEAADQFSFGKKGEGAIESRRLTRFLFYLVCADLLRKGYLEKSLTSPLSENKFITFLLLKMQEPDQHELKDRFYDAALNIIDFYFDRSNNLSVEEEKVFLSSGRDPNKFLKSSALCNSKENYPIYFGLIDFHYKQAKIGEIVKRLTGQESKKKAG